MLSHDHFQPKRRPAPVSNTERQRQFRLRNPGYYGRLHRARDAQIDAALAAKAAMETLMQKALLCLPAPAEQIRIPGVNAIPTREELAAMQAERAAA
jgi:hypothetical protein